ncbi:MAG: DegT/DnrJ/EryC1/StrS family aminotransferase [Candidatus Omnitrophica bacterium]|nr:DegT/DnrJ/EryC1/StrS family aminotransferase [Candidatus Omnitrophota bacterium]
MKKNIRLSKSVVGLLEKKALSKVIDDSYLGMGSFVRDFEKSIEKYIGAGKAICVNSGTAALHLALMSIGLVPGDEVLVQSLTFVACFQAISAVGAVPVACEVIPETCMIDLKDAKKRITKRTKAIMPVHYASRTGNLEEVYRFAKEHGLRVIEDAAHAFGTVYKGKKVGSFGDVICFSFDGIKNITCGEGGAVVTKDAKVAEFVMDARLLGVHKDTEARYQGKRSWEFDVFHQGFRYHMSNLFAAIGLSQLKRFEKEFKPSRQKLAKKYHNELGLITDIELFPNDYDEIVPHIFPIKVINGKRDSLRQYLIDNNIECAAHYYPNHLLSYYGKQKVRLPVTEKIYSELLSLPLHPDITDKDQKYIIEKIKSFFTKK